MNKLPKGLKVIMFDLGGVIIDLDYQQTAIPLAKMAGKSVDQLGDLLETSDILKLFEVGAISEQKFREEVCSLLGISCEPKVFDQIWNALLGEISIKRMKALKKINIPKLILSNTNPIHERTFNGILKDQHGYASLNEVVDKVYFSHEVKMRKPNADIYEMVLNDQKICPEEILFIDDRADNIQGAKDAGIHTFQNQSIDDWISLLD